MKLTWLILLLVLLIAICGAGLVYEGREKEESAIRSLIVLLYRQPSVENLPPADRAKYLQQHYSAWLNYIEQSDIGDDGLVHGPAGQSVTRAINDGRLDAFRLIHHMDDLPLDDRKEALEKLHDFVMREQQLIHRKPNGDLN